MNAWHNIGQSVRPFLIHQNPAKAIMFDLHNLPASRVQVAISNQLACAQPAAIHYYLALSKRLPQICNSPLHYLATACLERAHQVVEKDRRVNDRAFEGIAISVIFREFLGPGMAKAI